MFPTLVAAAILIHEGKILLTQRRAQDSLGGYWEFPGGKVEKGEDPRQAVVRECREECGIEVEVEEIFEVLFLSGSERDLLLLFYRCRWRSGNVAHLEVQDHVWCSPGELDLYEILPANDPIRRKLQALLSP